MTPVEAVDPAPERKKGILRGLLGVLAVAAHAEAQRIHFFLILADQLFEGGFIPLLKARNEFPFVHSFLLILSADPA